MHAALNINLPNCDTAAVTNRVSASADWRSSMDASVRSPRRHSHKSDQ